MIANKQSIFEWGNAVLILAWLMYFTTVNSFIVGFSVKFISVVGLGGNGGYLYITAPYWPWMQ